MSTQDTKALRFNAGKPKLSLLAPEVWKAIAERVRDTNFSQLVPYATAGYHLSRIAHVHMDAHEIRSNLRAAMREITRGVRQQPQLNDQDDAYGMYSTYAMLAGAMEYGAGVYGRDNWKLGFPFTELIDASQRHLMKLCTRHSDTDKDSGVHHAGHAMFGINCMLYMLDREDMFKRFYDVQPESCPTPKEGA